MNNDIGSLYGDRVRIRVCGLCWQNDELLLVKHSFNNHMEFWAPPGGGVEFGETLEQSLSREFMEETGIEVKIANFRFGYEFIASPLHAIELFFDVDWVAQALKIGYDPEMQIIQDVQFLRFDQIKAIAPDQMHGIFKIADNASALKNLTGFYKV